MYVFKSTYDSSVALTARSLLAVRDSEPTDTLTVVLA